MRFHTVAFIAFVAILGCSSPVFSFDKALIGSWQGSAKNSDIRWDIRFGGAFTWTRQGPQGSVSATGVMTASDGQWMKSFAKEGSDSGSYTLNGPDSFVTVSGKNGRTVWTRLRSEASSSLSSATSFASSSYASPAVPMCEPSSNSNQNSGAPGSEEAKKGNKHGPSKLKQFFKNVAPMVGAAADIAAGTDSSNYGPSYYPQSNSGGGGQNDFGLGRLAGLAGAAGGGGDVHSMLINNFPLPPGADEAERFGLPGLGRLAGGGMRKREFRSVF
ncbi:MAG: hypothetical protein JST89_03795 [Cyanobacteria bacterium SZAS-4]|nr:hypothetical protein [Cyanobacteria bacterium SZAS-4]